MRVALAVLALGSGCGCAAFRDFRYVSVQRDGPCAWICDRAARTQTIAIYDGDGRCTCGIPPSMIGSAAGAPMQFTVIDLRDLYWKAVPSSPR